MLDELRRIALFGSGVAELTRHQAEQIVKDLVSAGDVKRKQASSVVKDLLEGSKENRAALITMIRSEIKNQLGGGGVSARDLERLERRVARLEKNLADASGSRSSGQASKRTVSSAPAPRKSAAKKTAAKKTAAKKTLTGKTTTKKTTATGTRGSGTAAAKRTVVESPPASDTGLADHEGS